MKLFGLWVVCLSLASCAFLQEKAPKNPWEYTGIKPRRMVLLVLETAPKDLESLEPKGLYFKNAWVGHLINRPGISFSVITQGLLPKHLTPSASYWIGALPGESSQKQIISSPPLSGLISDSVIGFFKSQAQWTSVIAPIPATQGLPEVRKILFFLEQSDLLKETLFILTAEKGQEVPTQVFPQKATLPSKLNSLNTLPWRSVEADSSLRVFLRKKERGQLTKITRALKRIPEVSEIFYRTELSKRTYYIRTYRRDSSENSAEMEWSKIHTPILLQSIASSRAPDLIAFWNTSSWTQEQIQNIPLWIWAPHLRLNNPVIKTQMENTRVRLVDLAPMIFELLGVKAPDSLDGTSLGISSVLN